MGGRSAAAATALAQAGFNPQQLFNLDGGIVGWAKTVDSSLPVTELGATDPQACALGSVNPASTTTAHGMRMTQLRTRPPITLDTSAERFVRREASGDRGQAEGETCSYKRATAGFAHSSCFGARSQSEVISPSEQIRSDASSRWRSALVTVKGHRVGLSDVPEIGFSLSTQSIRLHPPVGVGAGTQWRLGAISLAFTFQFLVGACTLTMESMHPHAWPIELFATWLAVLRYPEAVDVGTGCGVLALAGAGGICPGVATDIIPTLSWGSVTSNVSQRLYRCARKVTCSAKIRSRRPRRLRPPWTQGEFEAPSTSTCSRLVCSSASSTSVQLPGPRWKGSRHLLDHHPSCSA